MVYDPDEYFNEDEYDKEYFESDPELEDEYCLPDEDDYLNEAVEWMEFEEPGGRSALRRATKSNPRIHPCPTCGEENQLTAKDVLLGYCCNRCADIAEGRGGW